jgi:putative oxidoreductase
MEWGPGKLTGRCVAPFDLDQVGGRDRGRVIAASARGQPAAPFAPGCHFASEKVHGGCSIGASTKRKQRSVAMSTRTTTTTTLQDAVLLLGRILLAAMFMRYGFAKIGGFAGTAGAIASKGVPLPEVAAAIAIAIEVGLGLCVIAGYKARFAAAVVGAYLAFITPLFHNFWALSGAQAIAQEMSFYKNLSGVGGLLVLAVFGAGGFSLDALSRVRKSPIVAFHVPVAA